MVQEICIIFGVNLAPYLNKKYAGSAPSIGTIMEQHQHQSIKKAQLALFGANKVTMKYTI